MKILLRTNLFDTTSGIKEGLFYGEDFAEWLSLRLAGWETSCDYEDWGWSLTAKKDSHVYIFGIYDHDTDDVNDHGPQWCIRVYNQRDWRSWFKSWIRYTPPRAEQTVVDDLVALLRSSEEIFDLRVETLD